MCRTDTQDKLHRGGYLGVLAVLMNLRKGLYEIIKKSSTNENLVCNHPDLLEPRPVESPFLISPITFHLPRLLVSILPHNLARGYTGIVWQKLPVTGQLSFMETFSKHQFRPRFQCICSQSAQHFQSSLDSTNSGKVCFCANV